MPINLEHFKAAKELGGVSHVKLDNDSVVLSVRRYDQGTGLEVEPHRDIVKRSELDTHKSLFEANLIAINTILGYLNA